MKVKLINHTPGSERTVASSARLCYSNTGADEIVEDMSQEDVERLLNIILSNGHHSTLEHISFTFAIEGISRVTSHQLVRHRIASYSQQSQRYVREKKQFDYVIPDKIKEVPTAEKYFKKHMKTLQKLYDTFTEMIINNGYTEKEAIESARYVLPNATETKIVVTMNARSLLHFFELRCCNRAQQEIRDLANEMLRLCKGVAPIIFKKAGAACQTRGICKEGKMSCGRLSD